MLPARRVLNRIAFLAYTFCVFATAFKFGMVWNRDLADLSSNEQGEYFRQQIVSGVGVTAHLSKVMFIYTLTLVLESLQRALALGRASFARVFRILPEVIEGLPQ